MYYIYISEIVRVVKADIIAIMVHSNLSTLFVVSHVLRPNLSPEWRLKPGFGIQKKCPFPLNRGVPSIELADTKNVRAAVFFFCSGPRLCLLNRDNEYDVYVNIFLGPNSLFSERRCPLNGCVPKERFHCNLFQRGDSGLKQRGQTNSQGL